MRLPLLIHSKPTVLKNAAKVSLGRGRWRIVHNVFTSRVDIERHSMSTPIPLGKPYVPESIPLNTGIHAMIDGECIVQVKIREVGQEEHLSIYAERMDR